MDTQNLDSTFSRYRNAFVWFINQVSTSQEKNRTKDPIKRDGRTNLNRFHRQKDRVVISSSEFSILLIPILVQKRLGILSTNIDESDFSKHDMYG